MGRVVTYGLDDGSVHLRGYDVVLGPDGSRCNVRVATDAVSADLELHLAVPGRHNVQNALGALAVGVQLGLPPDATADALSRFAGADRRFQLYEEVDGVVVIDDYGHHPTEVEVVVATARLRLPERLRLVFQPHRYSRTQRLLEAFGKALGRRRRRDRDRHLCGQRSTDFGDNG